HGSARAEGTGPPQSTPSARALGIVVALWLAALPLIGACSTLAGQGAQNDLQRFVAATEDALKCRAEVTMRPRYRPLLQRLPLTDLGTATLAQMTEPDFATREEISVLDDWTRAVNVCRQQLLRIAEATFPVCGPSIEAAQDNDDAVFVRLAERKLTWGQAVMQLKVNRTKLRADLFARVDGFISERGKLQQAEWDRRTTILSSVIRILP
ncbi:MAG TPA: hypothetical protein VHO91_07505, partial [Rhodopila sp.]|nr:hypothetical protein [Rhodopila sp.]